MDVGYEYDYRVVDYRRSTARLVESELIEEQFLLEISDVDHAKIKNNDMLALGWKRDAIGMHPETGEPTSYVYTISKYFDDELFNSYAVFYEDKATIKIYLKEKRFSIYAN